MTPQRWALVEELFMAAQELKPEARRDFVHSRCAGDAALEQEVSSLLQMDTHTDTLLELGRQPWSGVIADFAGPSTLRAESRFGPYVIGRLLGAGGMGEVYLAQDTRLQRRVALKLLAGWLDASADVMRRFTQEALAASALNHPNIPTIYETGEYEGRRFIASEYVEGMPLNERLRGGPLPWSEAVAIARKVAEALQAAHVNHIIHRDVKPGNIMVCPDGRVKLVDFGIAKVVQSTVGNEAAGGTVVGAVLGTPGYMAPEQAIGMPADARSDLWGLVAVLHEMLTGHQPGAGQTQRQRAAALPAPLMEVLRTGLNPDAELRYQSADDFIQALDEAMLPEAPRRRLAWWLGGGAILAAILAALGFGLQSVRPGTAIKPAIIVLRFDAAGQDKDLASLSSGIREEVLNSLGRISELRVLANSAAMDLPTQPNNLADIGRRLGATQALLGSVQVAGDDMRVSVRLLDTRTSAQLWSESYQRKRSQDVFDIERDISERVAARLKTTLQASERAAIEQPDTLSQEAHANFLRGEFLMTRDDPDSLRKAVSSFEQAIQLDPSYGRAYARLAITWTRLSEVATGTDLLKMRARARAAAERAVRLSPNLPEPHVSLGWIFRNLDWDLTNAAQEFEAASRVAPNSAPVKGALGALTAALGDLDRSAQLIEGARQLDPTSTSYISSLALVRLAQGRDVEAESLYREAVDLDPKVILCHGQLARLALMHGRREEALRQAALETEPGARDLAQTLINLNSRRPGDGEAIMRRFIRDNEKDSPFWVATLYAYQGNANATFEWLDKAYDERDLGTIDFTLEPFFLRFRDDPRYAKFRKKLGIVVMPFVHPPG